MTRLSKVLFAATALVAVPLTALAQDAEPPGDPTAVPPEGAGVPPANGGGAGDAEWSRSVINRPITLRKGKLGASADLAILHVAGITVGTVTSDSVTSEALVVGAGYGISDKLEVGGSYGFSLNEFEIKGVLTAYGSFSLLHNDKLDIGASADIALDFNNTTFNTAGESESNTTLRIHAGALVNYKITPKMAVFTGNPGRIMNVLGKEPSGAGPLGQHLSLGLSDGDDVKTFSLPVGFAFQATPELYAFLQTNLFDLTLSDVGDNGDRFSSIADYTPLALGALYSVNKNIDAGASVGFYDLQNPGDILTITVGARYYN